MSGGGSIHGSAFNPFTDWGKKSLIEKIGFGLPIGENIGSPKWIKAHPKEAMLAAATAATVLSGGAAAGMFAGAGAGAGAAGAGAAGAGAEGAGLLGASGLAEMGSMGAATPGIGSYLAASSAPSFGAGMGAGVSDAAELAGAPGAANPYSTMFSNFNTQYGPYIKKGLKAANIAQKFGLLGGQQQPMQPMGPRPGMGQQVSNTQIFPQQSPQMPPELAALPPNDPQVIAWKKQNGLSV